MARLIDTETDEDCMELSQHVDGLNSIVILFRHALDVEFSRSTSFPARLRRA
jgi:hypothetical protein